ncbi:MAG: hypothetical protein JWM17_2767 [Actinobacteria bacterium]|jgi:hypothetical protein|nr:hypothetical protein [Actinomycetota bacterium]MCW3043094.1 hypothetical protein [Actinomycetota bacterium]MEA2589482.1 hypothetical protein [Actinomycetota bacterium]
MRKSMRPWRKSHTCTGFVAIRISVNLPDVWFRCSDDLDDGSEMLQAPTEKDRGAAQHAPARKIEAQMETRELHIGPCCYLGWVAPLLPFLS